MTSKIGGSLLVCLALFASVASGADKSHALLSGSGARFEFPWSSGWAEFKDPQVTNGVAFELKGKPQVLRVLLSPGPSGDAGATSEEGLRYFIGKMIERLAPQSVEGTLEPQPLPGGKQAGFYVRATDKAPKPDEYKYVEAIVVAAGDAPVIITVLFNDAGAKEVEQVRAAMSNLKYTAP